MSKTFPRAMGLVITVVLAVSLPGGCGSYKPTADPDTAQAGSGTSVSASSAEPAVDFANAPQVRVMISDWTSAQRTASKLDEQDNPYSRYLFEKTGLRVVIEHKAGEGNVYNEQVYMTLASGNAPDLICLGGNDQFAMDLARSKALSPLNESFDKYPNLKRVYNDDYWKEYSFDSNKYVLKGVTISPVTQRSTLIRQDWLDKLKLKMPETVDELKNTIREFMKARPDGQPVLGLTGKDGFSYFYTLSSAFGCPSPDVQMGYTYVDKAARKLVFWNTTDAARAYFKETARWFKEGLVDPELVSNNGSFWDKITNGRVGVISYRADACGWLTTMIREAQKKTEPVLAVVPPLKGTGFKNQWGKEGGFEEDYVFEGYYAVPRDSRNIENVLKLLDFECTPEFLDFRIFGLEGIEHKLIGGKKVYNKENVNQVSFKDDYVYTSDRSTMTPEEKDVITIEFSGGGNAAYDPPDQAVARYKAAIDAAAAQAVPPQIFAAVIPKLDAENFYTDVQGAYMSAYVRAATGEWDANTDDGWQTYLKAVDDAGINRIIQAKENWLKKNVPKFFE